MRINVMDTTGPSEENMLHVPMNREFRWRQPRDMGGGLFRVREYKT